MNLETLLAILKEINVLLTNLQALGLKVNGTIDLSTLLSLVRPKA